MADEKSFRARLVFSGLAAILLFAVAYTAVTLDRPWPGLPYRVLRDSDLAAGLVFVVAVGVLAFRRHSRNRPPLG